jgi:hypothetical protein
LDKSEPDKPRQPVYPEYVLLTVEEWQPIIKWSLGKDADLSLAMLDASLEYQSEEKELIKNGKQAQAKRAALIALLLSYYSHNLLSDYVHNLATGVSGKTSDENATSMNTTLSKARSRIQSYKHSMLEQGWASDDSLDRNLENMNCQLDKLGMERCHAP